METKALFKNEHDELRTGWQLALFLLLLCAAAAAIVFPVILLLKSRDNFYVSIALCAGALVASYVAVRFLNKKPLAGIGLAVNRFTVRQLGIGCLAGYLMMTGIFGIEYLLGYVNVAVAEFSVGQAFQATAMSVILFSVAAMFEELVFRGYPFQTLVRGIGLLPSVIVMGILFALLHFSNPNASIFGLVNIVLVAVVFALAYWRTRSLWLPFGIHFAWNFSQTTFYGFPTSGIHFTTYELTRLTQFGPEWITGGAFGPEGGALATLMIVLCGTYIWFSRMLEPYPGVVTLEREEEKLTAPIFERKLFERKAA